MDFAKWESIFNLGIQIQMTQKSISDNNSLEHCQFIWRRSDLGESTLMECLWKSCRASWSQETFKPFNYLLWG